MTAKTKAANAPRAAALAANAPADDTAKQIEEAVAAGKQTIRNVVKVATDTAGAKAVSVTRDNVEVAVKAGSAAYKGYEDVVQFGRDNADAAVKAGLILAKGLQELNRTFLAFAQEQVEESVATAKALSGAKSLQEVIDIQSRLAKNGFDRLLAEGGKLNEVSAKLAEQALAPLAARLNVTFERAFNAKL